MNEIEHLLTEFNVNADNSKIFNYYNTDNIWKALRIERDENRHSAFLSWLLKKEFSDYNSPIFKLLNLLVRQSTNHFDGNGLDALKRSILNGTLKILDLDIYPEKTISSISKIRYNDRLDLYLKCDIALENKNQVWEIFVENKVDSNEGKNKINTKLTSPTLQEQEYLKKQQTERYYYACGSDNGLRNESFDKLKTIQLFVFLSSKEVCPADSHFIPVTYQNLVDYVLQPYLNGDLINEKTSQALQDYLHTLSNPFNSKMSTMATTNEEKELLKNFYYRNEALFKKALEVLRDESDTEEEEKSFGNMLKQMSSKKRRFYTINGNGHYKMFEVVAQFVKYRLEQSDSLDEIEAFIKKKAKELSQVHVSKTKDAVKRGDKSYEFTHDSYSYYVTKEWGGDVNGNFTNLRKAINDKYQDFQISEIL